MIIFTSCRNARKEPRKLTLALFVFCGDINITKISLVHTHNTHPFNGPLSGTTQVSRYQKGKTNLDFTEARDSEWQWHQLGCMQVCTLLHTDNHASTPPLSFLQAGCPSCRPTNSVKALKAHYKTSLQDMCKKLNSLKHPVRTTVAGSHN